MKKILLSILIVLASASVFAKFPKINSTPAISWALTTNLDLIQFYNPLSSPTPITLIFTTNIILSNSNPADTVNFWCNGARSTIAPGNSIACEILPGKYSYWQVQTFINGASGAYYILDK